MDEDNEEIPILVEINETAGSPDSGLGIKSKVPVTILTGYLGSGKTTLLNYILHVQNEKKIAVILNEFGSDSAMEKALSIGEKGKLYEEWLELANGCLCCSTKDNGVKAIENLMQKRGKFDYILVETTGLADPGPIASIFWMDHELGSDIYLDGIVTVVDAKYGLKYLQEPPEEGKYNATLRQVALADLIIVNKKDQVDDVKVTEIISILKSINQVADLKITEYCKVTLSSILDLKAYDGINQKRLKEISEFENKSSVHLDLSVGTITLNLPPDLLKSQLEEFLQKILWENETLDTHIWRLKGVAFFKNFFKNDAAIVDTEEIIMIQGVNDTYELTKIPFNEEFNHDQDLNNRLILIGRNLNKDKLINILEELIKSSKS